MNLYMLIGIVLILIILMLFTLKILKSNQENKHSNEEGKIEFKRKLLKVNLPNVVDRLSKKELRELAKEELSTYKALDYKNKLLKDMVKPEWHSWQVSIIIKMYKEDMDIFMPNYENYFPKELVDLSVYSLEYKLHLIFDKYNKEVPITGNKKYLKEHIIWTSKDMSILLLYLIKYKKDENKI